LRTRHSVGVSIAACTVVQQGLFRMSTTHQPSEHLIKKYPNRRLYDTQTSTYITLSDVKELVLGNRTITVIDAKTGEDLTRSILLQIIQEEEAKGTPMFTSAVLAHIIRYYGHAMQNVMGSYLEQNIQAFNEIQRRVYEASAGMDDGKNLTPEMWAQFMSMQGPMIQGMLTTYIEQSKALFLQMHEQMQEQAKTMIDNFPFAQEEQT
jgi:polyhydroxyalkanoate synthesis repressor PhaR